MWAFLRSSVKECVCQVQLKYLSTVILTGSCQLCKVNDVAKAKASLFSILAVKKCNILLCPNRMMWRLGDSHLWVGILFSSCCVHVPNTVFLNRW